MPIQANLDEMTTVLQSQPDRRRLSRRILGVGVGLVMITVAFGVLSVWHLRSVAIRDAESDSVALGAVLAEQTRRQSQVYDLIQRALDTRIRGLHTDSAAGMDQELASAEIHDLLRQYVPFLPGRGAVGIIDSRGRWVNSSRVWPTSHMDVSDREHYRFLRDTNSDDLHIMASPRNPVTGDPVIYLSRRITAPDGSFLGIVVGAIDVPELARFYQTLSAHEPRTITLLRSDGLILASYPHHQDRIGTKVPAGAAWHDAIRDSAARDGTGALYRDGHFLIDQPVIASAHVVPGLALGLDIARREADILAGWRQQIRFIVAGQIIVIIATIVFMALLFRQFRTQDQQLRVLREVGETAIENARRLSDFAAMASDWFWEQDENLRFIPIETRVPSTRGINDRSSYGKTRRELPGTDLTNALWEQHEADLAARRPFRDFRYQRIGHDGQLHYLSVTGNPIFAPDGTFKGYRGVGRDVTADMAAAEALRLAKERAEAAVQARAEFLANMSHELRTPLNVIIGFADLIARHPTARNTPPLADHARDIHASGQDLLAMINAILDLSKLEDGIYQLRGDHVRAGGLLEACVDDARPDAEAKGIRLDQAQLDSDIVLYCDGPAVRQVIGNIISNAVKFTQPGGTVSAGLERAGDGGLAIWVKDTGIGIDPAVLKRLFEPFFQANSSLTRAHGGTGLGLAIAHKLMTLHRGAIEIDSTPAQGTLVRLTFPADRVIIPPAPGPASDAAGSQ